MSGEYISHYDLITIAKFTALCSNTSFSQEIHNLRNIGLVLWKGQQVFPSANGQKTPCANSKKAFFFFKSSEYKEASVSSQQPPNLSEGGAAEGRFRKSDPENQYRFKKEDRIIYSRNANDGWFSRASNQANSLSIHF